MKRAILLLALPAVLILAGMGSLGGAPDGGVPQTDENIRVRLTDRNGVSVELTQFSLEGKTAVEGKLGSGLMTVFFRNIVKAEFGAAEGDNVSVEIALKGGEKLAVQVLKRRIFYGATSYGAFQIRARDIARIEML
jgi:hypothetical protein